MHRSGNAMVMEAHLLYRGWIPSCFTSAKSSAHRAVSYRSESLDPVPLPKQLVMCLIEHKVLVGGD